MPSSGGSSARSFVRMTNFLRSMPSEEVAMEHQFFIRQQNLKLSRSLVAASEAAAAKADARQEKLLKLLAEEVANEPPPRKN